MEFIGLTIVFLPHPPFSNRPTRENIKGSQFLGAYLLCVPIQISQENLSIDKKSKILLRALGALRTLRSHRRVVADEAGKN